MSTDSFPGLNLPSSIATIPFQPPSVVPPEPSVPPTLPLDPFPTVSSPLSTSPDPSSTPIPSDTSSSDTSSTTMSSSSSSPSPSDAPVVATSSSSHRHAGAIAGGVIGGVAVLVALIAALLIYRYKRKSPYGSRRSRRGSTAGGTPAKHTGEDTFSGYGDKKSPTRAASTGSAAAMIGGRPDSSSIGHGRTSFTPALSREDMSSVEGGYGTPPTPSTLNGHKPMGIEDIPPLPLDAMPINPTNVAFPEGRARTRSLTSQNRAAALAKLDSGAVSQYPPSPSGPFFAASHRTSLDAMALSGAPKVVEMNRSSSGGRRATRKAVPKYKESEFSSPTSPTYPPTLPDTSDETRTTHSAATSSSNLHAMKSREDLVAAGFDVPQLNHKTSFGKPVHYLIPDLPPPQKD